MSAPPFVFADQSLPQSKAQEYLNSLKDAISEIQAGRASNLKFEELYRKGYMLTLHKFGNLLYQAVEGCVNTRLKVITDVVSKATGEDLLETIVHQWRSHKQVMRMIKDILSYLDKSYCKGKKIPTVYDMGLNAFRDQVVCQDNVRGRLADILLAQVAKERTGESIPRLLMKDALSMLAEISSTVSSTKGTASKDEVDHGDEDAHTGIYVELFETSFLKRTRSFYKEEMRLYFSAHTISEFLVKVESRIIDEESRADGYLDKSTKPKLRQVLQEELILNYSERIVNDSKTGAVMMLKENSVDDLERCYMLFSREPKAMDDLKTCMGKLVTEMGVLIVRDPENTKNPTLFVKKVLEIGEKFKNIVDTSFKSDRGFARTLKESVEHFINLDARAAQFLSLYIDEMFRKELGGMSEQAVKDKLSNVISIFRYIQEKDVFEDFYKKHLATRLLTASHHLDEQAEQRMISELKAECGHQYTSRLEGMFKDMKLSKEVMIKYNSTNPVGLRTGRTKSGNGGLEVLVLTTGFWPLPSVHECKLPAAANQAAKEFLSFYTTLHSGRRLSWQANLGSAELRVHFNKGTKDLLMHTYQMCIMMLFNTADTLTYKEIQKTTCIPPEELERHLLSLAHPKVRLLRKSPNNKHLAPDHTFTLNMQYVSKLRRIKVPLLTAKSQTGDSRRGQGAHGKGGNGLSEQEVPENVLELRKHRVEAAIVRIMKARKTLEHNVLVAEVLRQLAPRFTVEPTFIKKRIEALIEREYICRDASNRKLYKYLV